MKAITVIPGSRDSVQLTETDLPRPKSKEARIRIIRLGIDATDRDINAGLYGAPPESENLLVIGHEAVGSIESTGDGVSGFDRGDLVVPTVRRPCPENCLNCRNDQSDMCLTGHYHEHGIYKLHGFASELAVSDARYLVRIPSELVDVAVLLEPMSILEKAMNQIYEIQTRMMWEPRTVLVLGAGPVGQLATLLSRLKGLEVFTVARRQRDDLKARLVEETGATYVNVEETSLASLGRKFDIIIEGTGVASVALEAMRHLATNGVLCFLGVYNPSRLEFAAGDVLKEIVLRNKLLFGSVNSNKRHFQLGLKDLRLIKKKFNNILTKLITSTLRLDEYMKAFKPDRQEIKTVIDFS